MERNDHFYLNPIFHRPTTCSLNGAWNLKIVKTATAEVVYSGTAIVPFALETSESGVNRPIGMDETMIYSRTLPPLDLRTEQTVLLHFLAVDQRAEVYLNGTKIGEHVGGYLPFEFDIGSYLKEENVLIVKVQDSSEKGDCSYGKQKTKRGGIWYTPSSGIVQDVYLEIVPENRILSLKITPLYDKKAVIFKVVTSGECSECLLHVENKVVPLKCQDDNIYTVEKFIPWSMENPHLYDIAIEYQDDVVQSYFGLRKIKVVKKGRYPRLFLNDKPVFLSGVLDQGYYASGYTVKDPSEYENDLRLLKDMGFNAVRKHVKVEHPYFYYLCDKYGLLVIQDFINGGSEYKFRVITVPALLPLRYDDRRYQKFGRERAESRKFFETESKEIIAHLYNHPSVLIYTIFNEGWGQFASRAMTDIMKECDATRLYDSTSGWHDFGAGNFASRHVYLKKFKPKNDQSERVLFLSEFGGYGLKIENHVGSAKYFCYKKTKSLQQYTEAIQKLYAQEIIPAVCRGLCGAIYTQLTDVEDELNGLLTYDRQVLKISVEAMREINEKLYRALELETESQR